MDILLVFFALPIATIILSIALQKVLKCPTLVAAIIFAIFLVITFLINDLNFLIATIVYTIISFITATLVCFIGRIVRQFGRNNMCSRRNLYDNSNESSCVDSKYCNNENQRGNEDDIYVRTSNGITARVNIIPNSYTNGRTGCICGNCHRR